MTAIVIDSSAIIAIFRNEPEKDCFVDTILRAAPRFMSAVNLQEVGMVVAARSGDPADMDAVDALMSRLGIEVIAHDADLANMARQAFLRFGKGRHPARLNLGDCAAYALAKSHNLALLFKGDDFSQTDIVAASSES